MINNFLYGRKYRILVSDANNEAWEVSNLRCTFNIEKIALEPVNTAEVTIYNLTRDTETDIIKEGSRIIVEAGFQGYTEDTEKMDAEGNRVVNPKQYGVIFDGDIIQIIRGREENLDYTLPCVS